MKLETERLILREMNLDDYDALYRVLSDSDIMQHYPYTFDEKRVRGWIDRNLERYRIFGFGLWAVCIKETGEMIFDRVIMERGIIDAPFFYLHLCFIPILLIRKVLLKYC